MSQTGSPPRTGRFLLVAVLAVAGAVAAGWLIGRLRTPPAPPGSPAARAEVLFQAGCAICHGPEGRGDGAGAASLRTPPRDFAARPWRGEVTRESIRRVIRDGLPEAGMPAAATLSPEDVDLLAGHVLHLATSRPVVAHQLTPRDHLLREAGFVSLRGTAPPLRLTSAAGGKLRLSDLRGKLVLLHFWGVTCRHCLEEMPALARLEKDLARHGLEVLHVCVDAEDPGEAQTLLDRAAPGLTAWVDETQLGPAAFEVQTLPTFWLIDRAGNAIGRAQGARGEKGPALRRLLEAGLQ